MIYEGTKIEVSAQCARVPGGRNVSLHIYWAPMTVHRAQKMKKITAAFAKDCNAVMGGTAVAIWTIADLAKAKLAMSPNGVAIGGELPR